jgi:hypothetical protein
MLVYRNPQRQWLAAAEQELVQRQQERQALDARIAELRRTIDGLRAAVGDSEETMNASLPQLCLRVLSFTAGGLQSVPQVKQGLEAIGIVVPGNNPHAVLHTTLSRLAAKGYATAQAPKQGLPIHYGITQTGLNALHGT